MGSTWIDAVLTSLWAGTGATGLGALPALGLRELGDRARAALSGFSAGVMLAATFFSLLGPGLEIAVERWARWGGVAAGAGGLIAGVAAIALMHRFSPHEHFLKGVDGRGRSPTALARTWLFVIAITLHNLPEGLAVGVGVASGDQSLALPIALGIAFQNAPEGLVVAVSLVRERYSRRMAIGVALLSGAVEPIGAGLGAAAVEVSSAVLPVALCFAAGAMLFVISDEVLPESHRGEHSDAATWGTMGGFVLMMVLDVAFAA
ncbi:ZIP family metal transporter [Sandaracinus amylolyticus]|uniref:Metal transporter, ZIP family n=1 Tax=Sandaracinus amylolyticus TaxID=927083 RepID=A0A0F6W646_9BACT|nr:ZIP family metal transporter [Sandaracinus amylolyticus]AKF08252.1 Metal transporter, ZIP family [Sandaracinus amylolyticus]